MYSVTEGFDNVDKKLDDLVHDKRHVEALLVSVLVMERTLRRILHFCAINRGFSPDHYELLLRKLKYDGIKKAWPKFDRVKRPLSKFVGEDNLQQMKKSFDMRNDLVHGNRTYSERQYRALHHRVRTVIEALRQQSIHDLAFDPWARMPRRSPSKHPNTSETWFGLRNT